MYVLNQTDKALEIYLSEVIIDLKFSLFYNLIQLKYKKSLILVYKQIKGQFVSISIQSDRIANKQVTRGETIQ